ncbi:MAG: prepilin-type N-terminal cleavage/methylation domain-containing protein [Mariprofundaceae bacterium]
MWQHGVKQGGFTLIEVMISLALVGMIMLLVFSGLRIGSRSWNATELNFERLSDMHSVLAFVKRSVGNAYPLHLNQLVGKGLAFSGDEQALHFVTELANMRGSGGYYAVSMDREKSHFRVRIAAYNSEMKSFKDVDFLEPHFLSKDIERLTFSYFGKKKRGSKARWHHAWEKQAHFPQLVKVEVAQSGMDWPLLIVQPKISFDAACQWDNWYQRCIE